MNQGSRVIVTVLVLAAFAGGAFFWWKRKQAQTPPPPPAQIEQPIAAPAPKPVPPPPAPAAPAIKNPIEKQPAGAKGPLPALADADDYVKAALSDLLGRKNVKSFLNTD